MVSKWDIVFVYLNPVQGSEQGGKRPVLVISNDAVNRHLPIFTCIPFSSIKEGEKIYPTEIYFPKSQTGLTKDSVLMIHQIRTISLDRVIRKTGQIIDPSIKKKINIEIKKYFDL